MRFALSLVALMNESYNVKVRYKNVVSKVLFPVTQTEPSEQVTEKHTYLIPLYATIKCTSVWNVLRPFPRGFDES